MTQRLILTIIIISALCSTVFAVAEFGLYERIWMDRSHGILDLSLVAIDVDNTGRRILCASESRVFLSEDQGRTWRLVLRPGLDHRWVDLPVETESFIDIETEMRDDDDEEYFDRSALDAEELVELGILDFGEDFDSISDDELQTRLEDAGLLEIPEPEPFTGFDDDEPEDPVLMDEPDEIVTVSVNSVRWDPVHSRFAYVATSRGLYMSSDFGRTWRLSTIHGFDDYENVNDLAVLPPEGAVVVAMNDGLYISYDLAQSFSDLPGVPSFQLYPEIQTDMFRNGSLLAVSEQHVHLGRTGEPHEPVVFEELQKPVNAHSIAAVLSGNIYIAQDSTLYVLAEGNIWTPVQALELTIADIRDVKPSQNTLIVATNRGVYLWNEETGAGRYFNPGLTDFDIRDVAVSPVDQNEIWIATASGVYVLVSYDTEPDIQPLKYLPEEFPLLDDLIRQSLWFAEINLARDREWFDSARRSVLYPRLEFSWQFSPREMEQYTRSTVIATSGGQVYTGPYGEHYSYSDTERYRLQLRLHWSPNRAIFAREKVTIQQRLRNEVQRRNSSMNDIRRLYTLLSQLYAQNQTASDVHDRIDTLLRIQQAQAQLDALTGHVFDVLANH